MKKHGRNLLVKISQLLVLSRRWTAGFGELEKRCFQKEFFLAEREGQHSANCELKSQQTVQKSAVHKKGT